MQNRKTIFSLRTVSWFQNEKLHSHAYASFITILVRLGMRKVKKHERIFFFHDRSQVCFIELKTNKSMIRQVMQYFMRTFHSTALPFISFVWVLDLFFSCRSFFLSSSPFLHIQILCNYDSDITKGKWAELIETWFLWLLLLVGNNDLNHWLNSFSVINV